MMLEWIRSHEVLIWWMGALSLIFFVGTLIAIPILVVRIPTGYFLRQKPSVGTFSTHHPVLRFLLMALKNLAGTVFVVVGVAMLVLPGQGILTILIGLMLLDFPGKQRLELWIIQRRAVLRAINWMRAKAHRPPLQMPQKRLPYQA